LIRGSIRARFIKDEVDAVAYVVGKDVIEKAKTLGKAAAEAIGLGDFGAGLEETIMLYEPGAKPSRVILSGVGGASDWPDLVERLRVGVGAAVREARKRKGIKKLGVIVLEELVEKAAAETGKSTDWVIEQLMVAADMANYAYALKGKGDAPHVLAEIGVEPGTEAALQNALGIAEGVRVARDIGNAPPAMMNPERLEAYAREIAEKLGLGITVLHRGELESLGMGGILAVGQGSEVEPRLIILEYNGGGDTIAVVGKAVTFDAGGLDLKPPQAMLEMKYDKCGGAAAIGTVVAAARLKLPYRVVALVPAVENLPSGKSYKPLDVIKMYNGLTVEVGNTDAEGRLILADALAYAAEKYKPKFMVDFATLTGAAVVALGNHAAALFSNNEELLRSVEKASRLAGEPAWPMPLWPVYEKQLESKVADTNNVGGRPAGAITAAKFLEKFVGDTPWAHLDIAGTAWVQEKGPWKPYYPGGATGWGVRTVIELLRK
jgi:leucyl aminopeptidase